MLKHVYNGVKYNHDLYVSKRKKIKDFRTIIYNPIHTGETLLNELNQHPLWVTVNLNSLSSILALHNLSEINNFHYDKICINTQLTNVTKILTVFKYFNERIIRHVKT